MEPEKLIETLAVAERLKDATRHCYTSRGRRESVAEHSWRITLMAYLVSDEFPEADLEKLMKMCLIHDLGEAFTGDIPTFEKSEKDEEKEAEVERLKLEQGVQDLEEPGLTMKAGEFETDLEEGENDEGKSRTKDLPDEPKGVPGSSGSGKGAGADGRVRSGKE